MLQFLCSIWPFDEKRAETFIETKIKWSEYILHIVCVLWWCLLWFAAMSCHTNMYISTEITASFYCVFKTFTPWRRKWIFKIYSIFSRNTELLCTTLCLMPICISWNRIHSFSRYYTYDNRDETRFLSDNLSKSLKIFLVVPRIL